MSKTKHTEGKLFQMGTHYNNERVYISNSEQRKVCDISVIFEDGKGANYEEAEANAARLVKCWNMHDDLIDMIKKLKEELEDSQGYNYEGDAYKQIENAEKLIKQSEQ